MMLNLFNFVEWINETDPVYIFSLGLGIAVIICVLITVIIFSSYRSKHLKMHKININLDEGIYQNSSEDIIFNAKLGKEIDISKIVPEKEGYRFNGFNVYRHYISSTISERGISKQTITSEEMDGVDKSVITMPNYDLYLVAKYSPLNNQEVKGLVQDTYYSDFLVNEDLLSDVKHLNENNELFPIEIKVFRDQRFPNFVFLFKGEAIFGMIQTYLGLSKVYLRTQFDAKEKILNSFYQIEDINDAYNWYSFVIIYNTKPSRFINLVKCAYDEVDENIPTTQIEFNLITSSLSNLADPVLDRAVLIVNKYEEDRQLPNPPLYVRKRELPPSETEKTSSSKQGKLEVNETKKEETPSKLVEEPVKPEVKKEEPKVEEVKAEEVKVEEVKVEEVKVEEPKVEEINLTEKDLIGNIKKTRSEDSPNDYKIDVPHFDKIETVKKEKAPEVVEPQKEEEVKNVVTADGEVVDENKLSAVEKKEILIKKSPLKYSREKLIDSVCNKNPNYASLVERKQTNQPYSLKAEDKTYALVYENRFKLIRVVLRLDKTYYSSLTQTHSSFHKARFPIGTDWFEFYLDDSFTSNSELVDIFNKSRIYVHSSSKKDNK